MREKNLFLIFLTVTLLILGGGIVLISGSSSTPQINTSSNVEADIKEPTSFDWGEIDYNGGNVTKSFRISNTGTEPLELYNVRTSCHCTYATVKIGNETSQNFGMSGVSSWVGKVPAGKSAVLTVVFDPAYHGPQGIGPVTRFVSVESNDKDNPKLTFTLTGTVHK